MPTEPRKISVLLDGGVSERAIDELKAPMLEQGASAKLVRSENTRLSVVRGTVVRPPLVAPLDGGTSFLDPGVECRGLLPAAAGRTTAALFAPRYGNRTVYDVDDWALTPGSEILATVSANAYTPMHLTQAGAVPGRAARSRFAMATDPNGVIWYAWVGLFNNLYVCALDDQGGVVVPPLRGPTNAASTNSWLGLTFHGANGLVLWWQQAFTNVLYRASVTVSHHGVTYGTPVAVYTPSSGTNAFDVCRYDDTRAVLLGTSDTANQATARLVNVLTGTETLLNFAGEATGPSNFCAYTDTVAGQVRTILMTSNSTTGTKVRLVDNTFAALWTQQLSATAFGDVAARFQYLATVPPDSGAAAGVFVIAALTDKVGNFDAGIDPISTTFYALAGADGANIGPMATVYWHGLVDHGAQLRVSDSEMYALFFTSRMYAGLATPGPDSVNYVDDPSVVGWLARAGTNAQQNNVSPVARFGTVRFVASPARIANDVPLVSSGCAVLNGTRVFCAYRKSRATLEPATPQDYFGRYVELRFEPLPVRIAHDKDGAVFAAGALPVQWDGVELVELGGPMHRPHLKVALTGGSGPSLPAGVYSFVAVGAWSDASGLGHRVRISNIVTVTLSGSTSPVATVTGLDSLRNGQAQRFMQMQLYGTVAGGTKLNLMPNAPTDAAEKYVFTTIDGLSEANPILYSNGQSGQERLPQPPPPLADIAIIGSRAWGIDAEYRSRAVPSKLRVAGVGFEFDPNLEVNFPAGSGKLQRVVEVGNGLPIFLAEHGIYQIAGDGPSNTIGGGGSDFGQPVKISDYGCDTPESVQTFPGGVVWEDAGTWHVMTGGAIGQVKDVAADFSPVSTLLLADQSEVAFLARDYLGQSAVGRAKVFNYELERWTTWTTQAVPSVSRAVRLPWDRARALLYAPDESGVYTLFADAESESAANVLLETDWVLLGGDFQDHEILYWVVFRAELRGNYNLNIEVFTNYDLGAPTTAITKTNAELTEILDPLGRFTVKYEPGTLGQDSRAVKVRITDDTAPPPLTRTLGGGMRPIALTLVFALGEEMLHEEAFVEGSIA